MNTTTLIHPDLPLCWEDADTVRIGFDRAVARVHRPTAAMQRLIGALRSGVSSDRLQSEARRTGTTPQEVQRVLEALRPALLEERRGPRRPVAQPLRPLRPLRTVIHDDGRPVAGLRRALGATEPCDIDTLDTAEQCELIIHVERYLEPLEQAQRWLSAGIPHLLLRFTDRAVHVGPVIEASGAPCHSCVSLALVAADAALPVLATQLHGRVPQSETAAAAELAAAYAALVVREWLAGRRSARSSRWVIPVTFGSVSGPPSLEAVTPHPGCGCGERLEAPRAAPRDQRRTVMSRGS
ncbi:hypothetical protein [Leucobacter ruminantium]|uniref:Bacteriocin biosynthesis cyclodehydratase domain-containing protein n=1 Tax=Leucobacter ruminantium TaxID=1289170 RepID=A0A939M181_9MICO|nr:hypothetical protein [Leucobacter ruminantium]MBO1806132.1 hypothetical protein [Leucobacter ruminantium]